MAVCRKERREVRIYDSLMVCTLGQCRVFAGGILDELEAWQHSPTAGLDPASGSAAERTLPMTSHIGANPRWNAPRDARLFPQDRPLVSIGVRRAVFLALAVEAVLAFAGWLGWLAWRYMK